MRLQFSLTLAILSFATLSFAQPKVIIKANEAYASENYATGSKLCADAYTRLSRKGGNAARKRKLDMAFKTAECYRLTENYRDAHDWYETCKLLREDNEMPEVLLFNAEMLHMMKDFDKAMKDYEAYLQQVPGDERALAGIESCKNNKDYIANKTRHKIENVAVLNVKEFDMAPMIGDRKQTTFYFSSSREGSTGNDKDPRTGEAYMDLWVAGIDKKGNFQQPKLVEGDGINTVDNEGTVCFDERYKTMFFTRCPNIKKVNLGCDIWMAEAKGDGWKEPTKLELKSNDSISVGHPCTRDGKFLIFASDMPGGFGGRDLWYTTYDRKSESWTTPVNMGPEINTKGDELFPTYAMNGDLLFASNGHAGLGGLDIFRATRVGEENKWEKPTNLGSPINGEHNDYALIEKDERHGYFTSERKTGSGENVPDIYSYELPPFVYDLKVIVSDLSEKGVRIEDAKVTVKSEDGSVTWEGYTDKSGTIFWDKKPQGDRYINEDMAYTINIEKEGYYENKVPATISTIGLKYNQQFVQEMGLFPVKKPIRLPEVRYYVNKWDFVVDSTINSPDSLLFVYNLLMENPGLVLELSSHTDSRGKNDPNQRLSENRARACYKYLVEEKGVDPRRIVPVGKGENEPRTVYLMNDQYLAKEPAEGQYETIVLTEAYINKFKSNKQKFEMLHQLNRRTEGRVIALDFDPNTSPEADPKFLEYVKYP